MSALPPSPNLEQLRNRAKDLLRASRAADPQALARVAAHLPGLVGKSADSGLARPLRLVDALLVVAREHGSASWPRLKVRVAALAWAAADRTATPAPARPPKALSPSKQAARAVAIELVALATQGEPDLVGARMASLPLRDIVAVRDRLVAVGDEGVVIGALLDGLRHDNPKVRFNCAGALDHLADARCVEPLRALLHDPVPRVRRMALHALGCDACKTAPLPGCDDHVATLAACALTDPSISVRRHATAALANRRADARAVATLETLLARETDPTIVRSARRSLRVSRLRP